MDSQNGEKKTQNGKKKTQKGKKKTQKRARNHSCIVEMLRWVKDIRPMLLALACDDFAFGRSNLV